MTESRNNWKKFDNKLFQDNDLKARTEAKLILSKLYPDSTVIDNPDKYDVDLIVKKALKIELYCEVEIKKVWKGDSFPYTNVQFPHRKGRYAKEKKKPVYYMMFNNDLSNFLFVNGCDILKSPFVEVKNKYMSKGEMFYQVDLKHVKFKKDLINEKEESK